MQEVVNISLGHEPSGLRRVIFRSTVDLSSYFNFFVGALLLEKEKTQHNFISHYTKILFVKSWIK